jgi:hypothetical protein
MENNIKNLRMLWMCVLAVCRREGFETGKHG